MESSTDNLPLAECESPIAYMRVYKCDCVQPPAKSPNDPEHPETGSTCSGRITVLVTELTSGVHHTTFEISHRPL